MDAGVELTLEDMVRRFRVTELQALLVHAGKNKLGRKSELQSRVLKLTKSKSPQISMKIKELYSSSLSLTSYGRPLDISLASDESIPPAVKGESSIFNSSGSACLVGGDGKTVPVCPDIKMKELPFYDTLAVLLRPTRLVNQGQCNIKPETQHSFRLPPSQAGNGKEHTNSLEMILSKGVDVVPKMQHSFQVQLRFCALDSTDEQDDLFPQGLVVKVNGHPVQLPPLIPGSRRGEEPKQKSTPLNITSNFQCLPLSSMHTIHVSWIADQQKNYCMLINIVKRLTVDEMLSRLKGFQSADVTRGRIKEITTTEEDDLCTPTSIRVSVACPLGKSRMTYPCRAKTCKHLQCFDAKLFLLMNERRPTFLCPVCNKHLKFGDLYIDIYFVEAIKKLSIDAGNGIEIFSDGTWVPAKDKTEDVEPAAKKMKLGESASSLNKKDGLNETIDLEEEEDDDDIVVIENYIKPPSSSNKVKLSVAAEPLVIDLIDSSDEDNDNNNKAEQRDSNSNAPVSSPPKPVNQNAVSVASKQQREAHIIRIQFTQQSNSYSSRSLDNFLNAAAASRRPIASTSSSCMT